MNSKIRVLHIFDTAGVASLFSKYFNSTGEFESRVITSSSSARFENTKYYGGEVVRGGKYIFTIFLIFRLITFRPKIIHIHYWIRGVYLVARLKKLILKGSKIVFHAHGSDIRGTSFDPKAIPADVVLVSTKDLVVPGVIFVPNPVDPELFYPEKKEKGTAVFVRVPPVDKIEEAKEKAEELKLNLKVIDRIDGEGVPYHKFAEMLRSAEYFFDMKGLTSKDVLSKSGLEALACGCKVITDDGYIHTKQGQDPWETLSKIYSSLLEG